MSQPFKRVWRSAVSCTLVAVLALVSLQSLLHTDDGHDRDGGPVIVVHDAAAHRMSAAAKEAARPGETHCVVCHLFRTARASASSRALTDAPCESVLLTSPSSVLGNTVTVAAPLAARAPPAHA